jgi:hypothetical protein
MSEMVERVAVALQSAIPGLVNPEAWPWITMAHAAIEAMREPTDTMLIASLWEPEGAKQEWQSMIDAALTNPKGRD